MRDKDSILLEQIISEMGRNLSYTKTLPPERETRTSRAQTPEEQEKRIIESQLKFTKLFKNLETNPDDYKSAEEIFNILEHALGTKFGEFDSIEEQEKLEEQEEIEDSDFIDDESSSEPATDPTKRTEFIVDGVEMSWQEILQKLLDATKTDLHDYTKLLPKSQGGQELKVDDFLNERIPMKDPNTGEILKNDKDEIIYVNKTPETRERVRRFYRLYRKILKKLEIQAKPRSPKEEDTTPQVVYYFSDSDQPIKTTIYVYPDGTVKNPFDKNKRFLGRKAPKPKGFSRNFFKGKNIDEIKNLVKDEEAYKAFLQRYPQFEINELGEKVPTKWAWLYARSGKPPEGFWEELYGKKDSDSEGSLEEAYLSIYEDWEDLAKQDPREAFPYEDETDDFENETEEDLYKDDEEFSCDGDDEGCSNNE